MKVREGNEEGVRGKGGDTGRRREIRIREGIKEREKTHREEVNDDRSENITENIDGRRERAVTE